jgi:hypothetical protein
MQVCEDFTIGTSGIIFADGSGMAQSRVSGSYDVVNIDTGEVESSGKHRSHNIGKYDPITGSQWSVSVGMASAKGDDWVCRSRYLIRHVDGEVQTEKISQKCT